MSAVSTIQRWKASLEDVQDPNRLLSLLNTLQSQIANSFGIIPARVVRDIGYLVPPQWIDATLTNSWVAYNTATRPTLGFYKDEAGKVHLRGSVKSGTYGASAILTLPAGYRPPLAVSFPAIQTNATYEPVGRVDIATTGVVTAPDITSVQTGVSTLLDFGGGDVVSFDADNLSPPFLSTALVLANLGLSAPATGCTPIACQDLTVGQAAPLPRIAWQRGQNAIVVTQLFGLLPNHSYSIRLEITSG